MVNVIGKEIGTPGGVRTISVGRKQTYEVEPLELNGDLQFPQSLPIYDALRSQDGHVGSVLSAILLPVTSASWDLQTDGVRPEVVALVRNELGLPAPGETLGRRRRHGIVWKEHVTQAAETMLWAGFCPFEQVYEVEAGADAFGLEDVIHLRKVAQRLPRTVSKIEVEADGGLKAIHQTAADFAADDVVIPVDRLLFYVNRREGADWSGRSILRQAYKHWLIKDGLLRLDAQAAERNSMGIPVVYYSNDEQRAQAEEAVKNFRAGASAGMALPITCKAEVIGTSGATVDLIPRIQYHDQEIARSALAMFLDLGHDNGARSLGEVHLSVFMSSVQTFAEQIATTATEHMIRDLVELNYGPEEPYPALTPGRIANDISSTVLKELVDAGVVVPDDDLESHIRTKMGLPAADKSTARQPKESAPAQAATMSASEKHDKELSELLERTIQLRNRGKAGEHVQ